MATAHKSRCENCIIRQLNELKTLSKEELKSISDSKSELRVPKGESLFEEGKKLNGVFCVRSGSSKLSKMNENGKQHIVKIAPKGEVLGKRSLLSQENAQLSAYALEDMEVCFIPKVEINQHIENNLQFTQELLKKFAQDLKESQEKQTAFAQQTVVQRLAATLLYLQEESGIDKEGYISLSITREDLASVIGTATESCIRLISQLKKKNIITTQAKRIKILNQEMLKNQ
jgi:CRP-like cAMP-binding protein